MRQRIWKLVSGLGKAACVSGALLAAGGTASASDDGGLQQFFREQFGLGNTAPPPRYYGDLTDDHELVVRPHKHSAPRRPHVAVAVGPMAPVSIYDDKTLRPGDAVMTAKGIRVFLGGRSTPYSEDDFVALSDMEGLPRQVEKALVAIDKGPRT